MRTFVGVGVGNRAGPDETVGDVADARSARRIIVDGKVFDVTPYVDVHIGGEDAITRYAGQDNTKPFHGDQHPLKVREVMCVAARASFRASAGD